MIESVGMLGELITLPRGSPGLVTIGFVGSRSVAVANSILSNGTPLLGSVHGFADRVGKERPKREVAGGIDNLFRVVEYLAQSLGCAVGYYLVPQGSHEEYALAGQSRSPCRRLHQSQVRSVRTSEAQHGLSERLKSLIATFGDEARKIGPAQHRDYPIEVSLKRRSGHRRDRAQADSQDDAALSSEDIASQPKGRPCDHLGSSLIVTGAGGALISRVEYEPYGQATITQGAVPEFGFAGERFVSDVGVYDFGARMYGTGPVPSA